jgi:hypothetical protein
MCPEKQLFRQTDHERGVHQAVEGRMGNGEAHVRHAHRGERFAAGRCALKVDKQDVVSFIGQGAEKGLSVLKMTIWRGLGDARLLGESSETELLCALVLKRFDSETDERGSEIAVVIVICVFHEVLL